MRVTSAMNAFTRRPVSGGDRRRRLLRRPAAAAMAISRRPRPVRSPSNAPTARAARDEGGLVEPKSIQAPCCGAARPLSRHVLELRYTEAGDVLDETRRIVKSRRCHILAPAAAWR
jgi:hypothetical protein